MRKNSNQEAVSMKSFNLPSDKDVESVVLGMLLIESTAINAVSSVLTRMFSLMKRMRQYMML